MYLIIYNVFLLYHEKLHTLPCIPSGQGWSFCGELADCELDGSEFLKVYAQYNDTSISTTILA